MFATVVSDFEPRIWQRKTPKPRCPTSGVHRESAARPKEGSLGSLFGSNRESPSELEDVLAFRDKPSKSSTNGILDDTRR